MPEKSIKIKKDNKELEKDVIEGFRGGKSVDLNKALPNGENLRTKLTGDIETWVADAINSQSELVTNIARWNRQYQGHREASSSPYPGVANVATPTTRSRVEALVVRIFERLFSQQKVYIIKAKLKDFVDFAYGLEEALDWWVKVVKFKIKLRSPLLQGGKIGTGIVKLNWKKIPRTIYLKGKDKKPATKKIVTEFDAPDVEAVSREDLIISSEATSIDNAFIIGHGFYLRRPELERRVALDIYDEIALEKMKLPDDYDETKKERAKETGVIIEDGVKNPFRLYELWLQYDVDGDGLPDDIVITYHRATNTIIRAIYNPFYGRFRPYVALIPHPREYVFDGEGGVGILESLQEEIDKTHNQRLDRMTQINNPYIFAREGLNLPSYVRAPGKIIEVDDVSEQHLRIEHTSDVYPSTFNEEALLNKYADEAMGVAPEMMGMPTAERPVAKEALARLGEGNKKFMYISDNVLEGITEIGKKVLEMIALYRPSYKYYVKGLKSYEMKTIDFPLDYLWDCVTVELSASKELLNQTERRESTVISYQMLSDAATKLFGMAQMIATGQLPSGLIEYVMRWMKITETLLIRWLRDMNHPDAEDLVAKIEDINVQGMIDEMQQKMAEMMAMAQAQGQGGQGQGGGTPQGAPPTPPQTQ